MTLSAVFSEASILLSIGGFWLVATAVTTALVLPLCIAAKRGDVAEEARRQAEQPGFVLTLLEPATASSEPVRAEPADGDAHAPVSKSAQPARSGAA